MKSFQQNIVSILASINTLRIFSVISLLFLNLYSFGGNYTWSGGTSTSWTTTTNWTPNGNPSTNDSVTIKKGTFNCLLGANTTVKQFTLTADTIDLGGNTLTVSNNLTFTAGFITNGTLTCNGTGTASLGGGTIDVTLNVTGNSIQFSGGTFNYAVTAVKKGSGSSTGTGGCTFSSIVNLTDSGSGTWTLANSTSDTWNGKVTVTESSTGNLLLSHHGSSNSFLKSVTFKNTSTGNIYCDYYGTSSFHDSLIVNSTGGGDIIFGLAGGITTLDTSIIMIGSSGFSSSGELYLAGIKQLSATKTISLTATGTAEIRFVTGSEFDGRLTVSAPHLFLDGGRFNGVTTLTHTGTNTNSSVGLCYFADSTYITHDATSGSFYMSTTKVDTFDAPVTILNDTLGKVGVIKAVFLDKAVFINHAKKLSGVGTALSTDVTFLVGDAGSCTFHDSLTLKADSANIVFGTSAGAVDFKDSAYINIDSSYIGNLKFRNTIQHGSHAVNVPFQNNSGVLYLDSASTFNAAVTCHVKRVQLNGTTFNSSLYLIRNGTDNDTSAGGNTFNGNTTIIDSNSTTGKLLALANKYTDDFNGQATFKQYGSGKILPAFTKNTTFSGDIVIDGTSEITFGYGGGKVILDDTSNRVLSKVGSYNPIFKKFEMKKNAGTFTLTMPLTVTDSAIFTKGYLLTDSVHLLIISDNGVVTGANDSSLVIGPVMKSGNDAFTFPLGTNGFYHPLSISAPTSGAFTAKYVYGSHGLSTNADSTIENESLCEYWKVQRDTGTSKVLVRLGWNSNSCNVFGKDSMRVAVWDTATTKWKDKGNAGTTGTLSVGTVISNDSLNLFGIIALADKFCTSLNPSILSTDVICFGNNNGSATSTPKGATPPYSYSWSPVIGGAQSVWNLSSGTYYVTVTDSRGCAILDSAIVDDPDSILFTITTTSSSCHSSVGTAKVVPTGMDTYFYFWDHAGETTDSIGALPAGIYEVSITDLNGCSIDTVFGISDSDGPDANVDSMVNVDCNGNNSGLFTIACPECSEEFTSVLPCSGGPGPLSNLEAGTYPVTIDDGGCITIFNVTITQPSAILLEISSTESLCGDSVGTATVSAAGGTGSYTYQWSNGGTSNEVINLPAGFDSVIVTDGNGCRSFANVFIGNSDGPTLSISHTNNICFDGHNGEASVSASGNAPFTYYWYPNGEITDSIDSLSFGEFMVLVTDSSGCIQLDTVTLENPNEILIQLFTTNPTSDTSLDGTARVEVSGGSPPYSYSWSTGGSSASISSLDDGSYTVNVSDNSGCMRTIPVNLQSALPCNPGTGCYGIDYLPGCNNDPCGGVHNCYSMLMAPYSVPPYNTYPDFGANPSDMVSDECAFEAADQYIRNYVCGNLPPGQIFTLFFPPGDYYVGRETPYGSNGNLCFYGRGHNIIVLTGCENILFKGIPDPTTGDLPHIRYIDCLRYGSFVPLDDPIVLNRGKRYLPCGAFCETKFKAFPGDLFDIINSHNIFFRDLELDGNLPNLNVGGANSSDGSGIIGGQTAIELYDQTYSVFLHNINIHDFGYVGLGIHPSNTLQTQPSVHVVLVDSKFNNNGCCGFAWESGSDVRALRCEFNKNAIITLTTMEASGIDIESESYASHPLIYRAASNGHFTNCEFKLNYRTGVQNSFQPNLTVLNGETDFDFKNCLFVGHASGHDALKNGNPICLNAKRTHFSCCTFVGPINYIYDARINVVANNDETRFKQCNFLEEYTVDGTPYSFTPDCFVPAPPVGPNTCDNNPVDIPNHQYMLHLGDGNPFYSRVNFDQCNFRTNYNNQICRLCGSGGIGANLTLNCQVIQNCYFINTGLNGRTGVSSSTTCPGYNWKTSGFSGNTYLFQFQWVNFVGMNRLYYTRWSGCHTGFGSVRNAAPFDYVWDVWNCYKSGASIPPITSPWICQTYYTPLCLPVGLPITPFDQVTIQDDSYFQTCRERFPDATPTYDLFSCPESILDGLNCSGMRISALESERSFPIINLEVHPNPTSDYIIVKNLLVGDQIYIYDLLGNLILKHVCDLNTIELNISRIAPGIYIIKVNGKNPQKILKISSNQ